ncbi:LysR family transcriptional regulator [Companilactobacillus alimentarius]|uniref:LysR family transcriptional regulator n=1 Tax=Companilactobacillus alimentarius TaxID=1602 RepID=UPI0028B339A9|nr:LysR family transcriptional regulator [Companilactobacillus alimentarius]MDT6951558.1 LysR family transcriptional regulator [Companilactobacillus alimentarius]
MIDFYLLKTLVTFDEYGTLSKAAGHLGVTQPALTRSLKNLEENLGVQLFDRTPNRLYLTDTGKYAVQQAKRLIAANYKFTDKVKLFEQNQSVITIGANAPGPLIVIRSLNLDSIVVQKEQVQQDFEKVLNEEQVTCLLTNKSLETKQITSAFLGSERMAVNLTSENPLSKIDSLRFVDLAGNTFLCPQEIGFWKDIYESQIPDGKFIYQNQSTEYKELLSFSSMPFFTTNLTKLDPNWGKNLPDNRVLKPLMDASANQTFYISFLKRNQNRLKTLIQKVQDQWSTVDF